jgi:tetratricopeptide (TPR) repeat protein
MNLAQGRTTTKLSKPISAQDQCLLAKQLENIGQFYEAQAALSELWAGVGHRPDLQNLDPDTQAELLLRAGTLSGWIGSAKQIAGAQDFAKDLLAESIRAFEELKNNDKVSEAQTDLAICYWRDGAMDEARIFSKESFSHASTPQTIARCQINQALIEVADGQLQTALRILKETATTVQSLEDPATKGRYHTILAVSLKRVGGAENLDRALIEYTAASIHFEQAGHVAYYASGENNISSLLLEFQRYDDALQHLDNAYNAFTRLKDLPRAAQTFETRARIFIAQRRYKEAEHAATVAIKALQKGSEQALLAEALTTQAIALARLKQHGKALTIFGQAAEIATQAGDPTSSIRAKLTSIEEIGTFLNPLQLSSLYIDADQQVGPSNDITTIKKLRACAAITIRCLQPSIESSNSQPAKLDLQEEVLRYEASLINQALDNSNGHVTAAARALGVTHQGLAEILATRHKNLRRLDPKPRRRSIMKKVINN